MVAALCLVAIVLGQNAQADPRRVIIDVDQPSAYRSALHSAERLKRESAKEPIEIEILCHGKGIDMLAAGGKLAKQIAADSKAGVVFAACSKSMAHGHLEKKDIYSFARIVDSGSAELARTKKAGWTYVKPGS